MGALTYDQRMMRDRVGRDRDPIRPTPADATATVYRVTWWASHGQSSILFSVLALDVVNALELAARKLALDGETGLEHSKVEIVAWPSASLAVKEDLLRSEPPDLCDLRQQRYREREA